MEERGSLGEGGQEIYYIYHVYEINLGGVGGDILYIYYISFWRRWAGALRSRGTTPGSGVIQAIRAVLRQERPKKLCRQ